MHEEIQHDEGTAEICPRAKEWAKNAFSGDITYLLNEAASSARSTVMAALAPIGITPRQMSIMRLLSIQAPIRQHELGSLLSIDRTSMVAAIDGLEGMGYVVREADPNDRRAHAIQLTEAGVTIDAAARVAVDSAAQSMLEHLTVDERETLLSILGKLTSRS